MNPAAGREIALGVAATLVFFLSALFVPVAGFFAGVFTPLPTLLSLYKWERLKGYIVPAAAAAVGAIVLWRIGAAQIIPIFSGLLSMGLVIGFGMKHHWSAEKTIVGSSFFLFGLSAVLFWLSYGGAEGGILKYLEEDLRATITSMLSQYDSAGVEKQLLEQTLETIIPAVVRLLPGAALSSAMVISWMNILAAVRYCRKRRLELPDWGEWILWKAPEYLVWGVIASGFMLLMPTTWGRIVALNILLVLGTVYFFQGLAVVGFYFERWRVPRLLRAVILGFFLLQQFATLGAALVGLFDMWFDFRKLTQKPTPDDE